jgi:hypothetical protein
MQLQGINNTFFPVVILLSKSRVYCDKTLTCQQTNTKQTSSYAILVTDAYMDINDTKIYRTF